MFSDRVCLQLNLAQGLSAGLRCLARMCSHPMIECILLLFVFANSIGAGFAGIAHASCKSVMSALTSVLPG